MEMHPRFSKNWYLQERRHREETSALATHHMPMNPFGGFILYGYVAADLWIQYLCVLRVAFFIDHRYCTVTFGRGHIVHDKVQKHDGRLR